MAVHTFNVAVRVAEEAIGLPRGAALHIAFGTEMRIQVLPLFRGQPHVAGHFDPGTVVDQTVGFANGLMLTVQAVADKHAALAGNQGAFLVGDVFGADIQTLPGSDGGSLGSTIGGFLAVGQAVGRQRKLVTIDTPAADILY